jgi:glycosyltransferase involved in cell wall biosynthesis
MRIALVTDYLNQSGGAERVVASLHRLFPTAPIFTTIADRRVVRSLLDGADIRTSWMQRLPGLTRHYRKYFMLYPHAIESLNLRDYDLVVSNSSAYAKSAITRPDACHVCYCHTPMRFAWNFAGYAAREEWHPVIRAILPPLVAHVRRWDLRTATRPTLIAANSAAVAIRVQRHYQRRAPVIHPPVEVERFRPSQSVGERYLVVSRLVAYKRIDLAVAAFTRMRKPLLVIGDGPARAALERQAGPTITFLGRRSDEEVAEYYATSRGLIFPGEEDFGITPLESNAAGRPVIAYQAGGALDTIVPEATGVFFPHQTVESLCQAVRTAETIAWDTSVLRAHAAQFREERFHHRFMTVVNAALQGPDAPLDPAPSYHTPGNLATV